MIRFWGELTSQAFKSASFFYCRYRISLYLSIVKLVIRKNSKYCTLFNIIERSFFMSKDNMDLSNVLKVEGVNARGYGIVPKIVMQDQRLSRDAKAIYCYFASYAGRGDTAFPSVSKICFDLGFKTEETYRKHFNQLKKCDYVRVTQQRRKGQFYRNIYTLVSHPEPEEVKESETKKNRGNRNIEPTPNKQGDGEKSKGDVNKPYPESFGDGEKTASVNPPTNSNSLSKNNKESKKNSIYNNNNEKDFNMKNKKILLSEIENLKEFRCKYNTYIIPNKDLLAINKVYSDSENILEILEYIRNTEPIDGYSNVVGAIIKAKDYSIPSVSTTKNTSRKGQKRRTKFHNFDQRSDMYSEDQMEEIIKKKRMEHKKKKEIEEDLDS